MSSPSIRCQRAIASAADHLVQGVQPGLVVGVRDRRWSGRSADGRSWEADGSSGAASGSRIAPAAGRPRDAAARIAQAWQRLVERRARPRIVEAEVWRTRPCERGRTGSRPASPSRSMAFDQEEERRAAGRQVAATSLTNLPSMPGVTARPIRPPAIAPPTIAADREDHEQQRRRGSPPTTAPVSVRSTTSLWICDLAVGVLADDGGVLEADLAGVLERADRAQRRSAHRSDRMCRQERRHRRSAHVAATVAVTIRRSRAASRRGQWRKWRVPVRSIVAPAASTAATRRRRASSRPAGRTPSRRRRGRPRPRPGTGRTRPRRRRRRRARPAPEIASAFATRLASGVDARRLAASRSRSSRPSRTRTIAFEVTPRTSRQARSRSTPLGVGRARGGVAHGPGRRIVGCDVGRRDEDRAAGRPDRAGRIGRRPRASSAPSRGSTTSRRFGLVARIASASASKPGATTTSRKIETSASATAASTGRVSATTPPNADTGSPARAASHASSERSPVRRRRTGSCA